MTTLVVQDLLDDGMSMVLAIASANPRAFVHRVSEHAGVIARRCSWGGEVIGFKEGGVGITDTICPKCAKAYALEARN